MKPTPWRELLAAAGAEETRDELPASWRADSSGSRGEDRAGELRAGSEGYGGWVVSSCGWRNQDVLKAMGLGRRQAGARDAAAGKLHGTPAGRRVGPETGSW